MAWTPRSSLNSSGRFSDPGTRTGAPAVGIPLAKAWNKPQVGAGAGGNASVGVSVGGPLGAARFGVGRGVQKGITTSSAGAGAGGGAGGGMSTPSFGGMGGGGGASGRYGSPFPGRPRMGSAAGALGSGGIPTSARGRAEKFGEEAASMPTWAVAEAMREAPGANGMSTGLSQSQRYGAMGGLPPVPGTGVAASAAPLPPPSTALPLMTGPDSALPWPKPISKFGHGTGVGRGRPVPHGQAFIAGDAQEDGKPNEELILPTPEGVHVVPLKDVPKYAEGTTRPSKMPPAPLPSPKRPTHGMDDFYRLNPFAPNAAQKEAEKLIMNPNLPMPIRVPKLANGTLDSAWGEPAYAVDELAPTAVVQPQFQDGEIRQDADGNQWRYDASQGRGIPLNPYIGEENRPSPITSSPGATDRYRDLANRLSGLRQEGMARGRSRVAEARALQQMEEAAQRLPESERVRTNLPGGGQRISGRYGTATIGQNVPKSFTVERMDGTQGRYGNLAEADAESIADAAQRRVRGLPMNSGRGVGAGAPTAIEELVGVIEPSAAPETPLLASAPRFVPLPDDRPSTVASRRRDWKMRPRVGPMTLDRAKTKGKEALINRASDFNANLQTAIDLGLVQPMRDFANNASTAWDVLTQ